MNYITQILGLLFVYFHNFLYGVRSSVWFVFFKVIL